MEREEIQARRALIGDISKIFWRYRLSLWGTHFKRGGRENKSAESVREGDLRDLIQQEEKSIF